MYTWHITFDQPIHSGPGGPRTGQAHRPARTRPVPGRWLHLTAQGVGFTDTVTDADIAAIIAAARDRLAAVEPPTGTVGPAR